MGEACKGRRCLQDTGPVDQLTETAGELEIERGICSLGAREWAKGREQNKLHGEGGKRGDVS